LRHGRRADPTSASPLGLSDSGAPKGRLQSSRYETACHLRRNSK
jgi:hypothetical protein